MQAKQDGSDIEISVDFRAPLSVPQHQRSVAARTNQEHFQFDAFGDSLFNSANTRIVPSHR